MNKRDNEEKNSLDRYKNEIKGARYVFSLFIVFFLFSKKSQTAYQIWIKR